LAIYISNREKEYAMKPQIIFPENDGQGSVSGGCDGDCACALPDLTQEKRHSTAAVKFTRLHAIYQIRGQISRQPLSNDFWVLMAPQSQPGWAVVNESALNVLGFFQTGHSMSEWLETSATSRTDFIEATHFFYSAGFLTSDTELLGRETSHQPPLESWLFLTRACNMACAHCFVSKDPREMTLETGLQAIRKLFEIARRHGQPRVKIKYAGGEPTLRWDILTQLHKHALELSESSELPLSEIIVTNGAALSKTRLEYLKHSNIQIAISLDGFGEGHDRQRPFANGLPSFERIYKNILLALSLGMRPFLTITLTRLNLDELPSLTEFALQNNLFLNWNFYRPHIQNDPLVPEFEDLIPAIQKSLNIVSEYAPEYPFLDKLIDRSNFSAAHEHTCGAGRNYLSIDYDGSALPCHMLSGANQKGVPLNSLSHVKFDNFNNISVDQKESCNTCQWRYWCTGGCSLLARNNKPFYCEVYKVIYPEIMKIKGKQILALA
jgi:uncharacterized protein